MKKLLASISVITLMICSPVFQSCQSTKSSTSSKMLKFNFENGKGYDYELTTNIDQEVMGQTMKMDMTAYYSMNVNGESGDEKMITSTFERMKMAMDMGPLKIDVDTDKPMPADSSNEIGKAMGMFNKLFGAIKGRQFHLKVNAEGKVTEVTGFKEMANAIVDSIGESVDPAEKEQMRSAFDKQFNDEGIKSQFERILYIFPYKVVKVGDSWQKSTSTMGQMPAKYNSTYTVKEIEGDMVTLDEKSTIESEDEKMQMSGKVTGTIVVDSRSGLVVSMDQDMNMTVKTPQGASVGMHGVTKVKGKAN